MTTATSKIRPPLNGVDTPTLFATLDAVKGSPQLAKFQFRHRQRRGGPGGVPDSESAPAAGAITSPVSTPTRTVSS